MVAMEDFHLRLLNTFFTMMDSTLKTVIHMKHMTMIADSMPKPLVPEIEEVFITSLSKMKMNLWNKLQL